MDLNTVEVLRAARDRADLALGGHERVLAGGTWLFSEPQVEIRGLVDLTTMGWEPWHVDDVGLSIGATCTIAELVARAAISGWATAPLFRFCAEAFLMSFKIWNSATVGGNVALGLPAGAMISLLASLDAEALIWTPQGGERREPVADLVTGPRETSLAAGEVIRSLEIPRAVLEARTAFRKIALTSLGRSSSVVIGRLGPDGGLVLTVTAATPRPFVLRFPPGYRTEEVLATVAGIDDWYADAHGAPDWRQAVTGVLAGEVLGELS